jgi:hypothetical protein
MVFWTPWYINLRVNFLPWYYYENKLSQTCMKLKKSKYYIWLCKDMYSSWFNVWNKYDEPSCMALEELT